MFPAGLPHNSTSPPAALWEMAGAQDTHVKPLANHVQIHNFGVSVPFASRNSQPLWTEDLVWPIM